jgi:Protein of Unknown function (DUF2784)
VNAFGVLAGVLVAAHLAFAIFAAAGGLLVLRWPRLAWAHLPAVAWAVYIEVTGGVCPLTPLENEWRQRAGLDRYSGDFIAQYVFPALYPEGLTAAAQFAIGVLVLVVNSAVYAWLFLETRRRKGARPSRVPRQ